MWFEFFYEAEFKKYFKKNEKMKPVDRCYEILEKIVLMFGISNL